MYWIPLFLFENVAQVHWKSTNIPSLLNIESREKPESRVCVRPPFSATPQLNSLHLALHTQSSASSASLQLMFKCLHPILRQVLHPPSARRLIPLQNRCEHTARNVSRDKESHTTAKAEQIDERNQQ